MDSKKIPRITFENSEKATSIKATPNGSKHRDFNPDQHFWRLMNQPWLPNNLDKELDRLLKGRAQDGNKNRGGSERKTSVWS